MFGLGAVKKQEGRPARYATRQTTVGLLPFYFPCHLLTSKTPLDMCHPLTPHKFCCGHQYLTLALMASMNSTMSLRNNTRRTDVNGTHQHTNDGDNDVLGGCYWAASSA